MDTHLLETFLDLEKTRHFGLTAENQHITQAAVSMRIKQLESLVGDQLLVRDRHNLQMTEAGKRLLPFAQTMVNTWIQARQSLDQRQAGDEQISLGSTANLWRYQFQSALNQVMETQPELMIRAQALSVSRCKSELRDGLLDLVFLSERIDDSRLKSIRLGQCRLVLMACTEEPVTLATAQSSMILLDWGEAFAQFFARRFPSVTITGRSNLTSLAMTMMQANHSCCYLPESLLREWPDCGLTPIDKAPVFKRNLYAIWRADHSELRRVRRIAEQFRTEPGSDEPDVQSDQSS